MANQIIEANVTNITQERDNLNNIIFKYELKSSDGKSTTTLDEESLLKFIKIGKIKLLNAEICSGKDNKIYPGAKLLVKQTKETSSIYARLATNKIVNLSNNFYEKCDLLGLKQGEIAKEWVNKVESMGVPGYNPGTYDVSYRYAMRLNKYNGTNPTLFIPPISTIASDFLDNKDLIEEVIFTGDDCKIENGAFKDCSNLKRLQLTRAWSYEKSLFENCKSLETVDIKDKLYITKKLFYNCEKLVNIDISKVKFDENGYGRTFDNSEAFYGCKSLKSVVINGLDYDGSKFAIPYGCFNHCISIETVKINSEMVDLIKSFAFSDCRSLKEVELNEGLEVIEKDAFYGCTSLKHIRIPKSVKNLDLMAFSGCDNILIEIPRNTDIQIFNKNKSKELVGTVRLAYWG